MQKLQKGEIVWAIVEEVQSSGAAVLCSFQGKLLLLANQSHQHFGVGERIKLQVRSLQPLSFQIFSHSRFERIG